MNWQILILSSVFLYSASTVLQRILLKENKSDPVAYSIFFQLLTGFIIGGFGLFVGNFTFPNLKPIIIFFILMTFLYGFGTVFLFRALKTIEASAFTVIFSSRALFTILALALFIHEFLSPKGWLGAILVLSGVLLVSLTSKGGWGGKAWIFALLAAASFGFATANDRFLLKSFSLYPYTFSVFVFPAMLVLSFNLGKIKKMKVFLETKILVKMILLCIAYASSSVTFFSALQIAPNSSQVVTINLISVVITVILSIIILKERKNIGQKFIGAILSFIGLILVG